MFKPKTMNACVGATEDDFRVEEVWEEDDDDYEQRMIKDFEHKEKLAKLRAMRNMLKN